MTDDEHGFLTDAHLAHIGDRIRRREAFAEWNAIGALRLLNGFTEGVPELALDLYAGTVVVHDFSAGAHRDPIAYEGLVDVIRTTVPWVRSVLVKHRADDDVRYRHGRTIWGDTPDRRIEEHGVSYAVELTLALDASFFLDTRLLRRWVIEHSKDWSVLNTFAYTGSLGVAAFAGGARRVVQVDLKRQFLNVAKTSCTLNGFPIVKRDYLATDFFAAAARFKREESLFDCVIVDPPFFADTARGRIDLVGEAGRVLNKVRPLVGDGGYLIAINNALFLSGQAFMEVLDRISADGYLNVETLIPVPEDFTASDDSDRLWPTDPAPFNHPTKIAVLSVRRKDGRRA